MKEEVVHMDAPEGLSEGMTYGRNSLIENEILNDRKLFISREVPYTEDDFLKAKSEAEAKYPKILGLYVVESGKLKFQQRY
ncbi:hypothetical protein RZS08_53500 [Arthrospira platensis SPKY1]|nr:hypothetical protein [Arthrospira platensis SPKY1]